MSADMIKYYVYIIDRSMAIVYSLIYESIDEKVSKNKANGIMSNRGAAIRHFTIKKEPVRL